jgi:hypothetical protein
MSSEHTGRWFLGPRLKAAVAISALVFLFLAGVLHFADPDMFHGMALIRETLDIGRLPMEDRFAYTPTVHPVVHHEWAAAALIYFTATAGGAAGILILKYLLCAGIFAACAWCAFQRGASLAVLCPLAPAAIFMSWIGMTTLRAQVFTLLFLAVLFCLLEADRQGKRWWLIPWLALYLVWLNFHAGFVAGLAVFALYSLEQVLRRRPARHLILTGLFMIALIAVNPYGLHYYSYLARAIPLDRSLIAEWRPLWTAWPPLFLVGAFSVILVLYVLVRLGPSRAGGWLVLLFMAYAALAHQRHLSMFAVTWLCLVPPLVEATRLGEMLRASWTGGPAATTALWCVLAVLSTTGAIKNRPWELQVPVNRGEHPLVTFPAGAVEYLQNAGFRGNLMTPFTVGDFVTWKLHPGVKVSIDGRYEVAYPPEALREHHRLYDAQPEWREILRKYPTDAILIAKPKPISEALRKEGEWRLVYEDDAYEVFARPGLALPRIDRRGRRLEGKLP